MVANGGRSIPCDVGGNRQPLLDIQLRSASRAQRE